jgi:PBP1b-binding outer membrane lipoprotein LpoB
MNFKKIFFIIFTILIFFSCASSPKRLDVEKDILADTGELTPIELERTAKRLGDSIAQYFKNNPNPDGIFVALLPTKNNTSEQISVDVFDNVLVQQLLKNGIYTVRTEDRSTALKEIEFSMSGLAEKPLSIGKMKSPNYFIKTDIDENMFRSKGDKIVEQVINIELREVTTQLVKWSDRVVYRKKAVSSGGLGW